MIRNFIDKKGNRCQAVAWISHYSKDEVSELLGIEVERVREDETRVRGGLQWLEVPTVHGILKMFRGDYLVKGTDSDWDYQVMKKKDFESRFNRHKGV